MQAPWRKRLSLVTKAGLDAKETPFLVRLASSPLVKILLNVLWLKAMVGVTGRTMRQLLRFTQVRN